MGQIPGCHGHGQCLTPPPPPQVLKSAKHKTGKMSDKPPDKKDSGVTADLSEKDQIVAQESSTSEEGGSVLLKVEQCNNCNSAVDTEVEQAFR